MLIQDKIIETLTSLKGAFVPKTVPHSSAKKVVGDAKNPGGGVAENNG